MRGRNAAACVVAALLALCGLELRAQSSTAAPPDPAGYSAASLYNLGNVYARSGKTALAVLEYERARLLAPRDPDLEANLAHVRELAGLAPRSGDWLEQYGRFASPNTMYWVGIAGLALGGICLLMLRGRRVSRGARLAGAGCAVVMLGSSLLNMAAVVPVLSESVALRPVAAGVSPVAGADALFAIPAAATVRVLDRHAGYDLVRDSKGREGWVSSTDLAAVIPE